MKRIIRRNTFETNSSSTHSLTICTAEQWNEFKTTDKYLADWDGELFLVDELIEVMKIKAVEHPERYKDVDELRLRFSALLYTHPQRREPSEPHPPETGERRPAAAHHGAL